jgi:hypothetical protein
MVRIQIGKLEYQDRKGLEFSYKIKLHPYKSNESDNAEIDNICRLVKCDYLIWDTERKELVLG